VFDLMPGCAPVYEDILLEPGEPFPIEQQGGFAAADCLSGFQEQADVVMLWLLNVLRVHEGLEQLLGWRTLAILDLRDVRFGDIT
jgi:hypothetical protein